MQRKYKKYDLYIKAWKIWFKYEEYLEYKKKWLRYVNKVLKYENII